MISFYTAAALLAAIGLVHSVLGERYVIKRLAGTEGLPRLVLGGKELMVPVLRFAWHLTTIAWFGMAAILVLMARESLSIASAAHAVAATFLLSAVIAGVASSGRHYSWIVFLAVGVMALFGAAA